MPLFGRRKERQAEPPARDLAGDAKAMRAALTAMHADRGRDGDVDLRAITRDLLEGEVAAPTTDVSSLVRLHTDSVEFYEKEIRPSWEGLSEVQRAQRLEGFIELAAMLDKTGSAGLPPEMSAVVHTKTLLLAWAFDETYGYLTRLARGEAHAASG